jgi:hypothetical protein
MVVIGGVVFAVLGSSFSTLPHDFRAGLANGVLRDGRGGRTNRSPGRPDAGTFTRVKARLRYAVLGLATIALLALPTAATAASSGSAAQRLAEKYAPIAMLREQEDPPCDTGGEQYQPTSVGTVLGNPKVTLYHLDPEEGLEEVKKAPTAADIAGLDETFYLNLEGEALGDTCVYARDFARLKREGQAPPVVYAHIARETGSSGLALQYWFFWYFNQFNDLHEGDWEGMQLGFEANSATEALREEPYEMILFQHAGGERADWDDSKVQKEGNRPIVYPAAGSHATFYDSAVYVENGQEGSGLGCDNTSEPVREVRLRPALLPTEPVPRGPFKWLSYNGHWGEREKGYNNGPTGPTTKTVWFEPFTWMEEQRSTSPRLPGGSIVGPAVTGAFCGAVASASDLINLEAKSRPAAIVTIAVLIALLALFVGLTRWGPVDLDQLRARRSFGQLVRAARQLYGRHWVVLLPIGLTAIPIVGGVNLLAEAIAGGQTVDDAAGRGGFNLAIADLIQNLGRPIASAMVAAVVVVFVRELVEGGEAGFIASFRGMAQRFGRVVAAQLLASLGVLALALTVIGLPYAVYKYVAWQFVQQEVLFTDKSVREAFHGSSALVRGRWWHTVRVAGFLWLLSVVVGPVLGFALIFTNFSLLLINLLGSLVFALLVPYVALGHTLLYFDLQARAETEPVEPQRLRKALRRRFRRGGSAEEAGAAPGVASG